MDSAEIPRNTDSHADDMFAGRPSKVETDEGIGASNSTPFSVSSMGAMHISSDRIPYFRRRNSFSVLSNDERDYANVFDTHMTRSYSVLPNDERGYDSLFDTRMWHMRRSYSEPAIEQMHVGLSNYGQLINEVQTESCHSVLSICDVNMESDNSLLSDDETCLVTLYVAENNRETPAVAEINKETPSVAEINKETPYVAEINKETPSLADINRMAPSADETHSVSSPPEELHPSAREDEETMLKAIVDVCNNHSQLSGTAFAGSPSPSPDSSLSSSDEQDESEPIQHGSIQLRNHEVHQDGVSPQSGHHDDLRQEVFHLNLSECYRQLNVQCRIYGDQEIQPNELDMENGLTVAVQAESDETNDVMLSFPIHQIPTDVDVNHPDVNLGAERINRTCSTCFLRPRCTVILPCGHRICLECARVIRRCSVCQRPIQYYYQCPDCNYQQ